MLKMWWWYIAGDSIYGGERSNMQEKIMIVQTVILLMGLAVLAIEDLLFKEIGSIGPFIMGIGGALTSITAGEWNEWQVILRFIPGILVLFAAWLTHETIGYGDGLVILCLGCFLELQEMVSVCIMAVTLAGVVALFLLLIIRKNKKTEIPFIPFLFAGCTILNCMQGV